MWLRVVFFIWLRFVPFVCELVDQVESGSRLFADVKIFRFLVSGPVGAGILQHDSDICFCSPLGSSLGFRLISFEFCI